MRPVGVLAVASDSVAAGRETRSGVEWLERRPYASPDHLSEVADVVLAHKELRRTRGIRVVLHTSMLQLRTLHALPPVRQRELPDLVRGQVRRFFRTNGAPLVVDAVWTEPEPGNRLVRAAAAELPLVLALESAVERTGLTMLGIRPGGEGPEARLCLESSQARARRIRRAVRRLLPYATAAALTWVTAGGLYVGDLLLDAVGVEAETNMLQDEVQQVRSVRDRIAEFRPTAIAARAQGPDGAWVVEGLARITENLPDSCYVVHLVVQRQATIRLDGRASDPVAVVESLSEAGLGRPIMSSTPVLEPLEGRSWYRFALSLDGTT
jgi:hypothetical protein